MTCLAWAEEALLVNVYHVKQATVSIYNHTATAVHNQVRLHLEQRALETDIYLN